MAKMEFQQKSFKREAHFNDLDYEHLNSSENTIFKKKGRGKRDSFNSINKYGNADDELQSIQQMSAWNMGQLGFYSYAQNVMNLNEMLRNRLQHCKEKNHLLTIAHAIIDVSSRPYVQLLLKTPRFNFKYQNGHLYNQRGIPRILVNTTRLICNDYLIVNYKIDDKIHSGYLTNGIGLIHKEIDHCVEVPLNKDFLIPLLEKGFYNIYTDELVENTEDNLPTNFEMHWTIPYKVDQRFSEFETYQVHNYKRDYWENFLCLESH